MNNLSVAIAHSLELDSRIAIREIIEKCEYQLGLNSPTAGILYTGIDAEYELILANILNKWPDLQVIGCTTDGEFSSEKGYNQDSIVLILLCSDVCHMVSGCISNTADDLGVECSTAYLDAFKRLGEEPKLCILFSDVLHVNGETIIEQLTLASDGLIPIVGGYCGRQLAFW